MSVKRKKVNSSEFGRGFLYPLMLFACHLDAAMIQIEQYRQIREEAKKPKYIPAEKRWVIKYHGKVIKRINLSGLYSQLPTKPIPSGMLTDDRALSLWVNGASDHLYELEIPKGLPKPLARRIMQWRTNVLEWGHGKGLMSMTGMPFEEYQKIRREFERIILAIDTLIIKNPKKACWF